MESCSSRAMKPRSSATAASRSRAAARRPSIAPARWLAMVSSRARSSAGRSTAACGRTGSISPTMRSCRLHRHADHGGEAGAGAVVGPHRLGHPRRSTSTWIGITRVVALALRAWPQWQSPVATHCSSLGQLPAAGSRTPASGSAGSIRRTSGWPMHRRGRRGRTWRAMPWQPAPAGRAGMGDEGGRLVPAWPVARSARPGSRSSRAPCPPRPWYEALQASAPCG